MSSHGQLRSLIVLPESANLYPGLEARLRNVDIIEDRALAAGLSLNAAAGMVANAWAESRLNADAHDGGSGWGLFQLTSNNYQAATPGSMRKGTIAQRKDPVHNTNYMLHEARGRSGYWFRIEDSQGKPPSRLAYIFGRDLERCGQCGDRHYGTKADGVTPDIRHNPHRRAGEAGFSSLEDRATVAADFFPSLERSSPPLLASVGGVGSVWEWLALGALGIAIYNIQTIEDKIRGETDGIW